MKRYIIYSSALIILLVFVVIGCKKQDYKMASLVAPTDVVIGTTLAGQDAAHPNGDGSGDVKIDLLVAVRKELFVESVDRFSYIFRRDDRRDISLG